MRTELLEKLRRLGITQVNASYSGYGDSGNVDYLDLRPAKDLSEFIDYIPHPWKANETMARSVEDQIKEFLWSVAYDQNPGFENNDGGQGDIGWNITNDKITLDHSYNYTETVSEPTVEL
jgi:hypothetical protein